MNNKDILFVCVIIMCWFLLAIFGFHVTTGVPAHTFYLFISLCLFWLAGALKAWQIIEAIINRR